MRNTLTGKAPEAAVSILEKQVYKLRVGDKESYGGFLDFFYPVGSYYETSDTDFDPNESWGGIWELETEGQVHVSAGSNYQVNGARSSTQGGVTDGGAKEVTLTHEQSGLPSHGHGFTAPSVTGGGIVNGISGGYVSGGITGGSHRHQLEANWSSGSGGSTSAYTYETNRVTQNRYTLYESHTHDLPSHTHTLPDHSHSVSGGSVGNSTTANASKAHNNMQPYIVVNRWHRTG